MNSSQLINQSSGKVSFGSPIALVEAARRVMTEIDIDPASSAAFNETVRAKFYYTAEDDGLSKVWWGRIWLNWPFKRTENAAWVNKLVSEYSTGSVTQACCLCFAATSEQWFQPLMAYPQCYLSPRTNYTDETGNVIKGAPKGSVVTYLGPAVDSFAREFRRFGVIKVAYQF